MQAVTSARSRWAKAQQLKNACLYSGRVGKLFDGIDSRLADWIAAQVTRVSDSCGYGVPLMSLEGERPHADAWAQKKVRVGGREALLDYQRERNATSIDGLPAVELRS